jgi:Holliday junction resolvase RusA-like endonuclease
MIFKFDVEPVSQIRPRFARRGRGVVTYDPPKVAAYKRTIHLLASQFMHVAGLDPFAGAISLSVTFYRPIQKSISKKEHEARSNGLTLPTVKSDLDNYVKALLDGCNGAIYEDDRQIVDLYARKRYSDHPRIEMEILEVH